jgi:peptidylprolyl isomerase
MTPIALVLVALLLALLSHTAQGLQSSRLDSRRAFLAKSAIVAVASSTAAFNPQISLAAPTPPSLNFETSKSGIQWADAKIGTGQTSKMGGTTSVDYVLSTTGARYGSGIYKTADKGAPYRWTLGDGSTIRGLEEAIVGSEGMPPMQAGGIRRVIIPPALAYEKLASYGEDCGKKGTFGPVPPPQEAFEEFQRFKNIYCNSNRPYQPDVVLDIKLYGKRIVD